jgi:beta-galactosidase
MGFLVMDEAFDEWAAGKRTYSYHIYFREWHETDLLAMVRRDRNHPSVVMWSIGNEMPDQSSAEGHRIAQELLDIVMTEDPTRLVTSGNDNIAADGPGRARERYLDVFGRQGIVGYNYADRWHERRELLYGIDRHAHPDWRMVGTETGGLGGARGTYAVGNNPDKFEAFYSTRLIDVEQRWKFTLLHDYVIGDFMWTGIDYYGESRWPARGSTSGMIDNCGFPKDGYYFFKSIWTDEPVLHLYPHWNWEGRTGQVLPVMCYTNCDTVELFVNGRSFGTKYLEFPRQGTSGGWNTYAAGKVNTSTADLHLSWDVVYEPGELVAVGRRDGKAYTTRIVTAGPPAAIRLTVDRDAIRADPSDVAHVSVEIVDRDGNLVPTADDRVCFEVEGARLIGVESGDMRDLSSVKLPERRVFSGMALAIVQADEPGSIRVKATAEGLLPAEIVVTAR